MVEDWLELNSGGVPIAIWIKMTLEELRLIADAAPEGKGINRQLELCLVGLVSYFESFFKDLFALCLNTYPRLLDRFQDDPNQLAKIAIDPLLAIRLGDELPQKIGFVIAERFDFGTPKRVNSLYTKILRITPFSRDDEATMDAILTDRNLFVHHGGSFTYKYLSNRKKPATENADREHLDSLVVDKAMYFRHHAFVASIVQKTLEGVHRTLTEYGLTQYGFKDNAPISSLLDDLEPPDAPESPKPMSLYAQTIAKANEQPPTPNPSALSPVEER